MLRLTIARELREVLTSAKFLTTFVVTAVLVLLTFYLGARNYQTLSERHQAAEAENLRRLEGLMSWVEARPAISLPPDPVSCLVQGVSNDIGRTIEVTGRGSLIASGSRYGSEPLLASFRLLDLEFLFQVVLSLFAVVFAFDAISGEKESGTLRLVFSNPVPRATYVLGKMIGTFLGLILPLTIPFLLGCLLLAVMGVPMAAEHWLRLCLILGAGLLFLGVCVGASVCASALTHRSTTTLVALMLTWILAVLVWPRVATLGAARAIPAPSLDSILSQRSRLAAQLRREDMAHIDGFWAASAEQQSPAGEPDMAAAIGRFNRFNQELAAERQRRIQELERRLAEDRRNRQAIQYGVGLGLARLSPASAFSLAATGIAGTGVALPEHFLDQARGYQETFRRFQEEKTGGQASGEMTIVIRAVRADETPQPIDPHELPPFDYQPPPLALGLRSAMVDLGLLGFYNLLAFGGAFVAFLRYDVR